jgi:hypothetical protein
MLKEPAFANSLTILTGVSYIVLCLLAIVSRDTFRFLFNAQYLGAGVASLLPQQLPVSGFRRDPGGGPCLRVGVRLRVGVVVQPDVRRQVGTVPGTRCSKDERQGAAAHGFSAGMPTAQR